MNLGRTGKRTPYSFSYRSNFRFCSRFRSRYSSSSTTSGDIFYCSGSRQLNHSSLQVVSFTFNDMSLEVEATCNKDSVALYDGSSDSSPSLGRFCSPTTWPVTSTGSSLYVVFQTDGNVHRGRFSFSWTFVSPDSQGMFMSRIFSRLRSRSKVT